jgi:hypothetical protein
MDTIWKTIVGQQLAASLKMLENAMHACPEEIWSDRSRQPEFWYLVYHTLFWLDRYLSGSDKGFAPPAPFTLDEMNPAGILPERVYAKAELQTYLDHCRTKCRQTMETLTEEEARRRCIFPWGDLSFAELTLDNMRHVQHHAAQLNLILRQTIDSAPRWVATTGDS